jgi:hypothetical protein
VWKELTVPSGKMDRRQLPDFDISVDSGDDGMLENPGKYAKIKSTVSFKLTGLET